MVKIIWEGPETPTHDFREEVTDKLMARLSYRAGVTQGFVNMATGLNMSEGGGAGAKSTAKLKQRIRMTSAYVKMKGGRTLQESLECLDILHYTDDVYPRYDVVVLMGVVPTKKQKSKFFTGRHRQIICLQSELEELREELYPDAKDTYYYNFDEDDDQEVDETEGNLT